MRSTNRVPLLLVACAVGIWTLAPGPVFAQQRAVQRHPSSSQRTGTAVQRHPSSSQRTGTAVPRPPGSRPPTVGHPGSGYGHYYPYYGRYYRPYYSYPYYWSYYWPYSYWPYDGYYGYYGPYSGSSWGVSVGIGGGYWGGYPASVYYSYAGGGADWGGVKLLVKPKTAEVYVDGYYVGTVDDFDGSFQKLKLMPGAHEIEIYQDGFHALKQTVYQLVDQTTKMTATLEPLAPGEAPDPRPKPNPEAQRQATEGEQGAPPSYGNPPPGYGGPPQNPAPAQRTPTPPSTGVVVSRGDYGSLAVRVQPFDAEVVVDGETWHGSAEGEPLVLQLGVGSHHVEVRKDGFETYSADVDVHRGETTRLNVSIRARM